MAPKIAYCCPGLLTHCSYPWLIIFSMAGGKGIQLIEEYPVIDVVCASQEKVMPTSPLARLIEPSRPNHLNLLIQLADLSSPAKHAGKFRFCMQQNTGFLQRYAIVVRFLDRINKLQACYPGHQFRLVTF